MAGMIALGLTGINLSRILMRWCVHRDLRSFVHKGDPVSPTDADAAKRKKRPTWFAGGMAGMIALGSTGTDWSRSCWRRSVCHVRRSLVQSRAPVSIILHILVFTR